jgi:hypothetical protein
LFLWALGVVLLRGLLGLLLWCWRGWLVLLGWNLGACYVEWGGRGSRARPLEVVRGRGRRWILRWLLSRRRGVESLRLLLLWRRCAVTLPRGRVALRNLGTHGILVISRRGRVRHG